MYGSRAVSVVESDDPLVTCDPLGMPRSVLHETRGMEFVQAPDKVVLLQQYQRVFREIWTDGRSLPTDVGGTMRQLLKRGKEFDEQLCIPSEAQRYLDIMAKPAADKR
jgi:hypothetical protein